MAMKDDQKNPIQVIDRMARLLEVLDIPAKSITKPRNC